MLTSIAETSVDRVLPALVADLSAGPELSAEFRRRVFDPRRETTAALRSAIDRGKIRDDIDMDFVLDALAAPLYYRVLFRHLPLTEELAEQTVDAILAGLRTRRPSHTHWRHRTTRHCYRTNLCR